MKNFGKGRIKNPPTNTDKHSEIQDYNPHYTQDYFSKPRAVWGAEEKGLEWNYSDRLWEWDWNRDEASRELASKKFAPKTAAWVECFLRSYFEDESIEIVCIMAGFNVSTGYPYQIFGYKRTK